MNEQAIREAAIRECIEAIPNPDWFIDGPDRQMLVSCRNVLSKMLPKGPAWKAPEPFGHETHAQYLSRVIGSLESAVNDLLGRLTPTTGEEA
jgi:hypothetical protein